jgi:ATP-dependent RNA helicase DDX35
MEDDTQFLFSSSSSSRIDATFRRSLPIFEHRVAFLYALERFGVVLVIGDTGSGKSTQIPQYLHESGWTSNGKCVAVTQPRRLACTQLASRVSHELSTPLGRTVGYSIRFDDTSSCTETRIKFLTDGTLLREMLTDPLLLSYSVVVVDEAHERSLNSDALLGLLRRVRGIRRDLRLVIMSATLEAEHLLDFFSEKNSDPILSLNSKEPPSPVLPPPPKPQPSSSSSSSSLHNQTQTQKRPSRWGDRSDAIMNPSSTPASSSSLLDCCVIAVEGRSFPVEIQFLNAPTSDYVSLSASTVASIHSNEGPGDILVFLPGAEDINACIELVTELLNEQRLAKGIDKDTDFSLSPLDLLPLHANISYACQLEAIEPGRLLPDGSSIRKAIFATNIAETSVTIPGITFVIDCGFTKFPLTEPSTGVSSLLLSPVSRAAAIQRAGRAGRTKRGKCFRLYTEHAFLNDLPISTPAEVLRSPLAPLLLTLLALGVTDVAGFEFLTPPRTLAITRGLELLHALGAIEPKRVSSNLSTSSSIVQKGICLTSPIGTSLSELPCDPNTGRMLLASLSAGCAEHVLTIAAMLTSSQGEASYFHHNGNKVIKGEGVNVGHRAFGVSQGDHLTLLNLYQAYEVSGRSQSWCTSKGVNASALAKAAESRNQLRRALSAIVDREEKKKRQQQQQQQPHLLSERLLMDSHHENTSKWTLTSSVVLESDTTGEAIRKCILQGYPLSVARLDHDGSYLVIRDGHRGRPHPSSILSRVAVPPPFIVFSEAEWITDNTAGASLLAGSYTSASKGGGLLFKHCSEISFEWILQLVSGVYETRGGLTSDGLQDQSTSFIPPPLKMVYKAKSERNAASKGEDQASKGDDKLDNVVSSSVSRVGSEKISEMIADSFQRMF